MAQTIALQRGTTTVTANGSSGATLFTQSGGTATRVIVNNLGFYFTTTPGQSDVYVVVYLTQSGGQQLVLGRLYNQSPYKAAQFAPGISTTNAFETNPANINAARNFGFTSSGTNGVASADAQSISINAPSSTSMMQLNSNFYMGPGDSIAVKARGSSASGKSQVFQTLNISYSFTTITES